MGHENMSIVFSSKIENITQINSSFDSGVLRVCYTGKNRNNSFISKETFERCISSIYNCPIVCRYDRDTDSLGAHDMELVTDDTGGMRIVNLTHPVGVVPESANYWWEEIKDDSGIHEYLCVDALLWKRQEAYKKIKEDGITEESMEISIKEGEMIDGVYVIKRFEFTAFCLLGCTPCFESASLQLFSHRDFKTQLAEMMQEFKETFSLAQSSLEEVGIYFKDKTKGGNDILEQKISLFNKYGFDINKVEFKLEDYTIDELKVKLDEMTIEKNFALSEQFKEELIKSLSTEVLETCFGEMSRYWYVDYDSDAMEVYCYDVEDWNLFGFKYSMNGDNVLVHFASKKRKKFSIMDFDNGEQPAVFASIFKIAEKKLADNDAKWGEKFSTTSETISSMEDELKELRKFKFDIENESEKCKRNAILKQFSDLEDIEQFKELKTKCMELSVDALEEKCFAIRGRNGKTAKFAFEPQVPKLVVETTVDSTRVYGGVFEEYGITLDSQHN